MRYVLIGVSFVFLGILGVFVFRYVQIKNLPAFIPQQSTLILSPPKQAITATLAQSAGIVEHLTREADGYQEATPGATIAQGESIATKRGNATVTLQDMGLVTLDNESEISFVSLMPDAITFWQKSGAIMYEASTPHSFSVRIQNALVELSGTTTIKLNNKIITISVAKGTAKLALVDDDNKTQVWNILSGQTARIRDGQTVSVQ